MSENKVIVPVEMTREKRMFFIFAIMLISASITASGYGAGIVLPTKLTAIDGMEFYPICTALGTLGMMLALPFVGKLCDVFGLKRVVVFGALLQLISRIALMYTTNIFCFLILYALSSVGSGLYVSSPYSFVANVVESDERPKYYGILVTSRALGSLLGPLITGQLVDSGYIDLGLISYAPFVIMAVLLILVLYPNKKVTKTVNEKFDFTGVLLMIVSICCIVLWISLGGKYFEWISGFGIVLLAVGVLSLFFFVRHENRHLNPSVPIYLFKKKRFASAFICTALITSFCTCAASYVIVYALQIMKVSSLISSTVLMPMTITQAVFGIIIGRYLGRNFEKRFRPAILLSLLFIVFANSIFLLLQPSSSMIVIYVAAAIGGMGTVVPESAFTPFFQSELNPEEYNAAQGLFSFGASGGSCLYMAISGMLLNFGMTYSYVFLMAVIFSVIALCIGFLFLKYSEKESKLFLRREPEGGL